MKKIKLFLIRNYQRIIRFLISFSVIGCILAASFSASATVVYNFPFSRPEVNDYSCYIEILKTDGYAFGFFCSYSYDSNDNILPYFTAYLDGESFWIECSVSSTSQNNMHGLTLNPSGSFDIVANERSRCGVWLGSGISVSGIHCYNVSYNSTISAHNNDFTFVYGNDVNTNDKLDKIIAAIEGNKSSAEKSDYNGVSADQKTAQSDLDKAESSINADTASARTDTINLFKTFSIVGDIAKGMLAVTNIFNILTADLVFAPSLLNFALAVGAAAFLLGLSAIILKVVRSKE